MRKAVLDSTVLVSAFLRKGGAAYELLRQASTGAFAPCLADEILEEVNRVLRYPRLRRKARYEDEDIFQYVSLLRAVSQMISPLPQLRVVIRDPNDDMIIACAVKAKAEHIISRDKDLLDLRGYQGITILSPEDYLALLRSDTD